MHPDGEPRVGKNCCAQWLTLFVILRLDTAIMVPEAPAIPIAANLQPFQQLFLLQAVNMRNFAFQRGLAAGLIKAFYGISASIMTQVRVLVFSTLLRSLGLPCLSAC